MSKPVSINQYHLGLGVSGVFLLLLGSGEEWVGLGGGDGLGVYYLKKGLAVCVFHSEMWGECTFLEIKKSVSCNYIDVQT